MKNKFYLSLLLLIYGCSLSAQTHLFDNSMSTAASLRDPSRQSSYEIDAAIYNPAGVSYLKDGLTFSIGLSAATGTIPIQFWSLPDTVDRGYYSQTTFKSIPDIQMAFKQKKWAISFSYASEGGRGNWIAPKGFSSIDYIVRFVDHSIVDSIALITNALSSVDSIAVKAGKSSAIYYNHSFRLGFTYKFNDFVSGYLGLKAMYLCSRVSPKANFVVVNKETNEYSTWVQFFELKNFPDSIVQMMQEIAINSWSEGYSNYSFAFAPIIGMDFNHKLGNIGMFLEIPTRGILLDGDEALCSPWTASLGTSWLLPHNWSLNVGGVFEGMYKDLANSGYASLQEELNPPIYYIALSASRSFEKLPSSQGNFLLSFGLHAGSVDTHFISSFEEIPGVYYGANCGFSYAFSSSSKIDIGLAYRFIGTQLTSNTKHESNIISDAAFGIEKQSSQHFFAVGLSYTRNIELRCRK